MVVWDETRSTMRFAVEVGPMSGSAAGAAGFSTGVLDPKPDPNAEEPKGEDEDGAEGSTGL
jgi:hypothetical protein